MSNPLSQKWVALKVQVEIVIALQIAWIKEAYLSGILRES